MLRHSPGSSGGRQSLTKWPALASSAARVASAARNSSTFAGLVPSGTVVTRSVRYSMSLPFARKDLAISVTAYYDLCDYPPVAHPSIG
ncbi:MAG: hypothetical protein WAK50_05215 [Nitrososphaeraceae archaeon]